MTTASTSAEQAIRAARQAQNEARARPDFGAVALGGSGPGLDMAALP